MRSMVNLQAISRLLRPMVTLGVSLRRACTAASSAAANDSVENIKILGQSYPRDEMTTVTPTIISRIGKKLYHVPNHPVTIIKQRVVHHFHQKYVGRTGNAIYAHFNDVSPVVTVEQNFDSLLVATDHISRSKNDNYYINSTHLLRAHTSAHQRDFIKMGFDRFLVTGDVYRRDEIDSSHYPVFHQMEGVRLFEKHELFASTRDPDSFNIFEAEPTLRVETVEKQATHSIDAVKMMEINLKQTLGDLVKNLFGEDTEMRWNPCYFPFTHPSYELEIKFQGDWLEVLGSGIMRQPILENGGAHDKIGWAFGLGLDRLAMLLFQIPDIRLFWSQDSRFLDQFQSVGIDPETNVQFRPFSKYPPCDRDISFWITSAFNENDFYEIVRSIGEDLVEKVELVDQFTDQRTSYCYRISYRSMDRSVTNQEINVIQERVRNSVQQDLGVELR